jgi:thiol-disulfide isomerase/thioredoxin
MKNIFERIKNYYKKRSRWAVFFDVVFYTLILLLIIPATRKHVGSFIIKSTLRAPLSLNASSGERLGPSDYRWPFQTLDGTAFYLEQVRDRVVFLNFWATWCPPCIAEMPSIERLYEAFGDRVEFIMMTNETADVVRAFMDKHGYTFPVYIQNYQAPEIFETNSIPTTYIVDKTGNIRMKKKGAAKWDSGKIKELLEVLVAEPVQSD